MLGVMGGIAGVVKFRNYWLYNGDQKKPKCQFQTLGAAVFAVVVVLVVVKAQRQELKCSRRAPGYFTVIGNKVPPAARDSSEVARSQKQRCYPDTGNGGHRWCLSSSLFLCFRIFHPECNSEGTLETGKLGLKWHNYLDDSIISTAIFRYCW